MRRIIVGFTQDDEGDWIAQLSCGHCQHVHHRPPFQDRPWVTQVTTRIERIGTYLMCPLCDRGELPECVRLLHRSQWDERSIPDALLRSHHFAEGTWGHITVQSGQLHFETNGEVVMNIPISSGSSQSVPPGLDHRIQARGPVRLTIDYLAVEAVAISKDSVPAGRHDQPTVDTRADGGGDASCWAHLVCTVCGSMLENEPHLHGTEWVPRKLRAARRKPMAPPTKFDPAQFVAGVRIASVHFSFYVMFRIHAPFDEFHSNTERID